MEKAHAADYLKMKRFKRAEIQDGLGRMGGCWSFLKDISSRANKQQQKKSKGCVNVHSALATKKEHTFLMSKIDNREKAMHG